MQQVNSERNTAMSSKNGNGATLRNLGDLDASMLRDVAVEELPEVGSMADEEALDRQIQEDADKASKWTTDVMSWLAAYNAAPQVRKDRLAKQAKEYRETLGALLSHENVTIRRAVWLALYRAKFSVDAKSHEEVARILASMAKDGQLVETANRGTLWCQDKDYNFPQECAFEEVHITEVITVFKAMMTRTWACVKEGWKLKWERLLAQATIDLDQLVEGEDGVCAVEVPHQNGDPRTGRDGLEGGLLVVKSDGERITIVDVANEMRGWGNFERNILDARALRPVLFLLVESLRWDKPPYLRDMPEFGSKLRLLWFAIKRAMAEAAKKAGTPPEDGSNATPPTEGSPTATA